MIENIINGIIARIEAALPAYQAARHQTEILNNRNTQRTNRFAVRPLGVESAEGPLGTVGRLDLIQSFEIILMNVYTGNLQSDLDIIDKQTALLEDGISAFASIAPNKIQVAGVKNINNMVIEDPVVDVNEKLIYIPITITISYFRS